MPRSIFGWSYPPGCSGPPEEAESEVDMVREYLECSNVAETVIQQVCAIVEALKYEASRECPACEKRAAETEAEAEKAAEEYWATLPLPESALCPHSDNPAECRPCLTAGDLAYDAARERRLS